MRGLGCQSIIYVQNACLHDQTRFFALVTDMTPLNQSWMCKMDANISFLPVAKLSAASAAGLQVVFSFLQSLNLGNIHQVSVA